MAPFGKHIVIGIYRLELLIIKINLLDRHEVKWWAVLDANEGPPACRAKKPTVNLSLLISLLFNRVQNSSQ